MKKDLHPQEYRTVVIQDTSNGYSFLTRSTAPTDEKIKWEDGQEYPLVKVHISSDSHPFYTGNEKLVDIEGRVDKFEARRKAGEKRRQELKKKTAKPAKKTSKEEAIPIKLGRQPEDKRPKSKPKAKKPRMKPIQKTKSTTEKPEPAVKSATPESSPEEVKPTKNTKTDS